MKRIFLIIGTICIVYYIGLEIYVHKTVKYEAGRDTVEFYGDGSLQIQKVSNEILSFVRIDKKDEIEKKIIKYKKKKEILYLYGEIGYTVVNIKTKLVKQYVMNRQEPEWSNRLKNDLKEEYIIIKKYEDLTKEEREIFENIME